MNASTPQRKQNATHGQAVRLAALFGGIALALVDLPVVAQVDSTATTPRPIPYVNHTVRTGETLSKISVRYYGDESKWSRIYDCNRWLKTPEQLKAGQVICVPEPTRGQTPAQERGAFEWLRSDEVPKSAVKEEPKKKKSLFAFWSSAPKFWSSAPKKKTEEQSQTRNPGNVDPGATWKHMLQHISETQWFGRPLSQIFMIGVAWFALHMLLQGAFTWFAAHMAFVKDVSFKKAWRTSLQSETLAVTFLGIVGIAGLGVIYVATAPPGTPILSELLAIAERYMSTPEGIAVGGISLVLLYIFLGVRFIPQAFDIRGSQGLIVVVLSVLVPHGIILYLAGYRLGFI